MKRDHLHFPNIDIKPKWTIFIIWNWRLKLIDIKSRKKHIFLLRVYIRLGHILSGKKIQSSFFRSAIESVNMDFNRILNENVFFFCSVFSYLIRYGHWFRWVTFDWITKQCRLNASEWPFCAIFNCWMEKMNKISFSFGKMTISILIDCTENVQNCIVRNESFDDLVPWWSLKLLGNPIQTVRIHF